MLNIMVGKIASGKTFLASRMIEKNKNNGISSAVFSLSDPFKKIAKNTFGLTKTGRVGVFQKLSEHNFIESFFQNFMAGIEYYNFSYPFTEDDVFNIFKKNSEKLYGYYQNSKKFDSLIYRQILQFLGSGIGRELYPNLWIDVLNNKIDVVENFVDEVYIDDVRFFNEYMAFKTRNQHMSAKARNLKIYICLSTKHDRCMRRNISMEQMKMEENHPSELEFKKIVQDLTQAIFIINLNRKLIHIPYTKK